MSGVCRDRMHRMLVPLGLSLLLVSPWVRGQADGNGVSRLPENRPKIGLALSGGGARGYSHIGVLKALDEAGIPIDYIAGTSMGAIFGGLYAMGYTPQEMEDVLGALSWSDMLEDQTPRRHLVYRRKQEDSELTLDIELGIKNGKLVFPRGLSQGNQFKLLMRTLALAKGNRQHFEDLNIPFKAVATDIVTGEVAVLENGDFVKAIRASVALPGVFSPVTLDGRLLSDGGMVCNLPVDQVREMGADIVIAVDISKPLRTKEELESLLSISSQAISLLTALNVQDSLKRADIVITPDVGSYDFLDFSPVEDLVEEGRIATREMGDLLADLPKGPPRNQAQVEEPFSLESVGFEVKSISFSGLNRIDPRRVLHQINLRTDQWVDYRKLRVALHQLEGMQDFDAIDFVFYQDEEGTHLIIEASEKSYAPNYLRFGWRMFSNDSRGLELEGLINQSTHPLNRRGGEWRNQLVLGRDYGFISEFFQPFDLEERLFFLADIELDRETFNVFEDDQKLAEGDSRLAALGVSVGMQLQNWGEWRLGVTRGVAETRLRTGDPDQFEPGPGEMPIFGNSFDIGGIRTSFRADLLDDPFLPNHGFSLDIDGFFSMDSLGGPADYEKGELSVIKFERLGKNLLMGGMDLGSAFGSELPIYDRFYGGGLQDFAGLQNGQITGSYKGVLRAGYFRLLGNHVNRAQIGGWVDTGNYWQQTADISLDDPLVSASLFFGRETRFGPIYFGVGVAEGGHAQLFLTVGQLFR